MTDQDTATANALVITERVAASPEAVFDFLVDPDKLVRWLGNSVDIEPEPGGKFLVTIGDNVATGSYVSVDPPKQVVFTWGWAGSADVPPGSSTVTISLTPADDHTIVELRHGGLPGGNDDEHRKGWTFILPRLAAVVEGRDPGPELPHAD
jgi:uncharacterized protein YndB with AHSA1/START domain